MVAPPSGGLRSCYLSCVSDAWRDPVIEAYKRDVDVTLLDERLKRTVEERLRDLMAMQRAMVELRTAGRKAFGR